MCEVDGRSFAASTLALLALGHRRPISSLHGRDGAGRQHQDRQTEPEVISTVNLYHGQSSADSAHMIESAAEFERLRRSSNPDDYRRAAKEEAASVEIWHEIIEHYPEMRLWVAQNKTVPLNILEVLAQDADNRVRLMVSMKRKITSDILEMMAADTDESIRLRVARHRRTPEAVLERLAHDPWRQVREAARERLSQL